MAGKRVVRFDQQNDRGRRGSGRGGRPPYGAKGNTPKGTNSVKVEVPRFTVPNYLAKRLDEMAQCPPGHRFLLYFQGAAYQAEMPGDGRQEQNKKRDALAKEMSRGEWTRVYDQYKPGTEWLPLKDAKKYAIKSCYAIPKASRAMLAAIRARQQLLARSCGENALSFHARLNAPLAIGLGNPHPVENGFSFLQPYGIPYIPGSGIKGPLRRTAEELALSPEDNGWTIPLVWVLFGFDASSGYLVRSGSLPQGLPDLRPAFTEYARTRAASDPLLYWWLEQDGIRSALPREQAALASEPARFCLQLQDTGEAGRKLRSSIHWQGLLRFWDVFPDAAGMAVDILNPHHRDYYEAKRVSPAEVEAPKPVFFLTLAPGADMVITCELARRRLDVPLPDNLHALLERAVAETLEWTGIGAKTAVGYGAGGLDPKAAAREEQRRLEAEQQRKEEEEARRKAEEERRKAADPAVVRQRQLEAFVQALPPAAGLPGQALELTERIRSFEDAELRRACLAEMRKRYQAQIKKAKRNKKAWAISFDELYKQEGE